MDLRSRSEHAFQHEAKKDRGRAHVKRSDLIAGTENRYAGYTVYDDTGEKIGNFDALFVNGNRTPSTWECRRPLFLGRGVPSSQWT